MVDPGDVFRRAFSWLPPHFASQSDAPVGAPRQFGSTEHLSTEAIAAYVDGELRMKSYLRAAHHLSLCQQCAAEVEGQSPGQGGAAGLQSDQHSEQLDGSVVADPELRRRRAGATAAGTRRPVS